MHIKFRNKKWVTNSKGAPAPSSPPPPLTAEYVSSLVLQGCPDPSIEYSGRDFLFSYPMAGAQMPLRCRGTDRQTHTDGRYRKVLPIPLMQEVKIK